MREIEFDAQAAVRFEFPAVVFNPCARIAQRMGEGIAKPARDNIGKIHPLGAVTTLLQRVDEEVDLAGKGLRRNRMRQRGYFHRSLFGYGPVA